MSAVPKATIVRDRKYLDWLRGQPCIISGLRGHDGEAIDPLHIGSLGKGLKSSDDEALPVLHHHHADGHQFGEITMFRREASDWLIREALRAYAREQYRAWKATQ